MDKPINYGSPEVLLPEMFEYLSRGEGFWLVVTGNSMYPTLLHELDSVFVEPLTRELCVGDIPLVLAGDRHCVLHRVIQVDQDIFFMQGDALMNKEGPVPKSYILGVATLRRRRGKMHRLFRHRSIYTMTCRIWAKGVTWGRREIRQCIPSRIRKLSNKNIKRRSFRRK